MEKVRVLVFLGAPGSGKGTQSKILTEKNSSWKHISTGDLFRKEIASGSALGNDLKSLLDKGQLVPDATTMKVFESQIDSLIKSQKVDLLLLDGCIRTKGQAEYLSSMLKRREDLNRVPLVVELEVPEEVLVKRLTGRLINPRTGKIYHIVDNPPAKAGVCDVDGGPLIQRDDDKESVIRQRFQIFRDEKAPIETVLATEAKWIRVNANQKPEMITEELLKQIKNVLESGA
jgi:adenylate kinase